MKLSDEQIAELILTNKLLPEEKLKEYQQESKSIRTPLNELLVDKDIISDENLGTLIADALNFPFISLSKVAIPDDVLRYIPEAVAKKQSAIAFGQDEKGVKVAMSDPGKKEFLELVSKKINLPIQVYYATERDIEIATKQYHKEVQKSFDELVQEHVDEASKSIVKDVTVSKMIDLIMEHAYHNKASDVHIEPDDDKTLIRYRVDGILHDALRLPVSLHEQIVTRIKVLSRLRTDEHLSAQDGKMQMHFDNEDLDVRVSMVPIVDGEKVVMRLLSAKSKKYSLRDLGMSEKDLNKVQNGFLKPHGMVLSTGPTGSGKSTTIYAMIKIINTREMNIATIEDPVEYEIAGVNQIQVNVKTNLTFANGLRAILRQDPDVIFVGEIRDQETASIAINSAMTGHLVFSTLHTNDAATTLPRLIDMNIEPFLVASTVNIIIGQRLVRKICERCRYSVMIKKEEMEQQLPKWLVEKRMEKKASIRAYKGKGCPVCHSTGYNGRIGIFEILEVTPAIRELITAKSDSDVIHKKAVEEGMTTMLEDGWIKVEEGFTTFEEVLRVTKG